jgi:hypothetical protein
MVSRWRVKVPGRILQPDLDRSQFPVAFKLFAVSHGKIPCSRPQGIQAKTHSDTRARRRLRGPQLEKFPVFSLAFREIPWETGSLTTAPSANRDPWASVAGAVALPGRRSCSAMPRSHSGEELVGARS